jgi:uncharacterized membrane protein
LFACILKCEQYNQKWRRYEKLLKESMMNRTLYWLPRPLAILFTSYLAVFAFDVFGAYKGWSVVLALFMHLIPAFILLIITIIAWKHDLAGAGAFLACAVLYLWMIKFPRHWSWYLPIVLPAVVIGVLFFLNWFVTKKQSSSGS